MNEGSGLKKLEIEKEVCFIVQSKKMMNLSHPDNLLKNIRKTK